MEELEALCKAGAPIALSFDWDEKEAAIQKLLHYGYVQLEDVSEEGLEDGEAEHMLFILATRPANSVSLTDACKEGKDVLIPPSVAEEQEDVLKSFDYFEITENKVKSDDPLMHFKKCFITSGFVSPEIELDSTVEHRGESDEWKPLGAYQMDSSEMDPLNDYSVTAEIKPKVVQNVCVFLHVQAYGKLDNVHYSLKLKMEAISVGVSDDEFVQENLRLGFFPDRIKISLEPQWKDTTVPVFAHSATSGATVKHTAGGTTGGKMGYGGFGVAINRTEGRQWETPKESITTKHEKGGVAAYEWRLKHWENGKKYNREWPLLWFSQKLPKLPFDDDATVPNLDEKLPAVTWKLPLEKKAETLKFKVYLDFAMQFVYVKGNMKVFSPNTIPRDFRFTYPFSLPPFETIPSYLC